MKNIASGLLIAGLVLSSLGSCETTKNVTSKTEVSKDDKFKPSKNMVSLDALQGKSTVKLGEQCYYSGSVHGSVGITLSVSVSGDGMKLNKTFFEYDNPRKSNMSGGDGGTKTFLFDTLKKGSYTVIVEEGYRGSVKNRFEIEVTVE